MGDNNLTEGTFIFIFVCLSLLLLLWFSLTNMHLQRIEDAIREKKPSEEVRQYNEQLDLWREYRARKEQR